MLHAASSSRGTLLHNGTSVRYYAEWLDGEYVLLNHVIRGYDHSAVMNRAIRLHALLGSTVVLSDVQMIDHKTPIPMLFLDGDFRAFLRENKNFLALVAEPVRGAKHQQFAISMKGMERITDQANKPDDSYELAVTQLAEPIFRAGSFNADRYLNPKHARKGHVARVIRRFGQHGGALKGLLHALEYFSRGPLPTTTTPSKGAPERYDTLLLKAQSDHNLVTEQHAKRIQEIVRIQEEKLPPAQHGRRAAMRKVLGTGKWQHEEWTRKNARLYLDVVHAWNCAINRNIAPEAGALYEDRGDVPLSRFERSVSDTVGWFRGRKMPTTKLSDHLRRLLSWDPLESDWRTIARIARGTQKTAEQLQAALRTANAEARAAALDAHAKNIADYLTHVTEELPKWVWWVAKTANSVWDFAPDKVIDGFEQSSRSAPYAYALMRRRFVINTLTNAGSELL
jgi:hypothetical protein